MDTSKGSLEAVSGSNLPLKVEKDMTVDEVRVLALKTFRLRSVFLGGWKTRYFFILIPNLCTICLVQTSYLPLQNIKKCLANRIQKYVFILFHKDEEFHSCLLKGFADSVCQIYSFLWYTSCVYVQILKVKYIHFCNVNICVI